MKIRNYKSKEEAVNAIKKMVERKRIWTAHVQSGRSVAELETKGFKFLKIG